MTHFFEKRDRWGNGLSLWILLGCIFITPICAYSLRQTHIENDIEHWLPEDDPNAATLKWSMKQFHLDSADNVLVSWDNSSLTDPRIEKLADRLEGKLDQHGVKRGGLPQVARVVTPRDVIVRMVDQGVDRDEAIRRLKGVLVGTGPLKVRLSEAGRQRQKELTRDLILKAKSDLGIDLQILPAAKQFEELVEETTAVSEEVVATATTEGSADPNAEVPAPSELPIVEFDPIPAHDFQLRWKGMLEGGVDEKLREMLIGWKGPATTSSPEGTSLVEDCFQSLGSPVALSIVLSEAGDAEKSKSMRLIREATLAVGVPARELHLGGRPVASTALNDAVKAAAWNKAAPLSMPHKRSVILMSGLAGALMSLIMLRSIKLSAMVLFVSYFTVFATVAIVPMTGGSMNMVLVLMPTFLLVVVMSGAIHVAHYWRHAAFHNRVNPVVEASQLATAPCVFATVTTAIGLLSLLTSDLKPVRDFGIYSALGSFVGLAAVLYVLPSLLQLVPFKPPKPSDVDSSRWESYGRWCNRRRHWIVWGYSIATLACCFGLNWFKTETKVIRYFPAESQIVQDYWFLEENLAGIVPVDVIVRFDQQNLSQSNFLERMEVVRAIEEGLRKHPEISGAIALPDFRPITEKPATDAGALAKMGYHRKANEMEKRLKEGELTAGVRSFFTVAKEANELRARGHVVLNAEGDEMWRITAQCFIMTDTNFGVLLNEVNDLTRSVLKFHAGTSHVVTGMIPVFLQTQQALLDSQISSFGVAYLTVWIVMIFAVRNVLGGFLTMLPNVYPIGQIFGLISYFGIPVDIGTMMTASIAMGIGVDGTLHKLTWFRKGIAEGKSCEDSIALAVGHSGPAIWETSAVLVLGMLMLFPSDLLLISRFGWLMSAIIFVAVLGDILFLPALLGGWLGRMIIHRERPQPESVPSESSAAAGSTAVPQPHLSPANMAFSRQTES